MSHTASTRSIPTLILINGPPGVGKSALARHYVDRHPLALQLDLDAIRASLGGWTERDEARLVARELAIVMAETHLRAGHDVVIPQFLGRTAFIEVLDGLAGRIGAPFVEVLLVADLPTVGARFRARRAELVAGGRPHPEREIGDDEIAERLADAVERLRAVAGARPATHVLDASAGVDDIYRALVEGVSRSTSPRR